MSTETKTPHYRIPEDVADELGMTKTELRRYAKLSGHFTPLSKNRMTFDPDDIENIKSWVKDRNQKKLQVDPFAAK